MSHGHSHAAELERGLLADHEDGPKGADAAPSSKQAAAAASLRARRQLICAMVLCFIFMAGEVVGGYLAGSLAIMTE